MNNSPDPIAQSKEQRLLMPFNQRLLGIAIHLSNVAWMIALVLNIEKKGVIQGYGIFMPLLALSCLLEMWRWTLLGKQNIEIKGAYSLAMEVEFANRDFLLFSWYVIPPVPPRKLIDRYVSAIKDIPLQKNRGKIFARFWLKSEVTLVIASLCLVFVLFPLATPPHLWGLGKFPSFVYLYWLAEVGLFSKLVSIFLYSFLIRIFKGF